MFVTIYNNTFMNACDEHHFSLLRNADNPIRLNYFSVQLPERLVFSGQPVPCGDNHAVPRDETT